MRLVKILIVCSLAAASFFLVAGAGFVAFAAAADVQNYVAPVQEAVSVPQTALDTAANLEAVIVNAAELPATLQEFALQLGQGQTDQVMGIFVLNKFALPVVQQPEGQAAYVSSNADVLTEFAYVRPQGVIGILAHNTLAGNFFFELETGDTVSVVFGDGSARSFVITKSVQYQALTPDSPYSSFVDLGTGETISAGQAFQRTYIDATGSLVFQTCIARDGNASWGRIFITAEPIN